MGHGQELLRAQRLQLGDEPDVALPEPLELAVERLDLLPPGRGPERGGAIPVAFFGLAPVAGTITSWSCTLAPSVAVTCPDVGTNDVSEAGAPNIGAGHRYVSYVKDSTRENASSTQLIVPVGYVDDSAKGTLDNRRYAWGRRSPQPQRGLPASLPTAGPDKPPY